MYFKILDTSQKTSYYRTADYRTNTTSGLLRETEGLSQQHTVKPLTLGRGLTKTACSLSHTLSFEEPLSPKGIGKESPG